MTRTATLDSSPAPPLTDADLDRLEARAQVADAPIVVEASLLATLVREARSARWMRDEREEYGWRMRLKAQQLAMAWLRHA